MPADSEMAECYDAGNQLSVEQVMAQIEFNCSNWQNSKN